MKISMVKLGVCLWLILLCQVTGVALAAAQKSPAKGATLSEIQHKIQSVKDKQNLSDELKSRILAAYQEAEDNLKELENQQYQAESLKRLVAGLPLETKQSDAKIAEAEAGLKNRRPEKLAHIPLDELEQRLIIEKTRLSDLDAEIARNEAIGNELSNSPQVVREKITEIKDKQSSAQQEQQLSLTKPADSLQEREAGQVLLDSKIRLFNATLKTLDLENISNPMRLELQKDRLHLLSLQRERQMMQIAELDNHLLERRQQQIDQQQAALQQAEREAEGKHPLIREATKDNMRFNRQLQEINKNIEQYSAQKNDIDARNKQLEKEFQSAEQKINLAGLSPALGNLLREQRRNLPQRKQYADLAEKIQSEIANASLETYKLDEVKSQLADLNQSLVLRLERHLPPDTDAGEALRIRTELRMLLNDQKDLVNRLATAYTEYSGVLGDVDFTLQQMLNIADKFSAYLDQRLLWVPSAPVITQAYLTNIFQSLLWFADPHSWLQVAYDLKQAAAIYPPLLLFLLPVAAWFVRFRLRVKHMLAVILKMSGSHQYLMNYSLTLRGLGCILLLSLPGALVLAWLAATILLNYGAHAFSRAFAGGLLSTALSLAVLQFMYRMFKPEGVAESLFHWSPRTLQLLYGQLRWARFIIIPCIFIVAMTGGDMFSEHSHALGRTAQIVLMLVMSYVFHRWTHPTAGLGKRFFGRSSNWISRLRYVWYVVAVSAPWVVIGFAVAGYYQSALELQGKLIVSIRLLFGTALLHALVLHWLTITKRRLAIENARQKRKQADQAGVNVGAEGGYVPEETLLDISKINQQSDKLLVTLIAAILAIGSWMIWRDILPAFSIFDRIELWQHSEIVDGKETLVPITLVNLLISLFYTGLTVILVGNFPTLVDLISAGKFALTAGSRYALIQLARYSMVSIAFLAVANELGGSWSQVQWLVAALSVGLGFGLQEIFANMVSGIILLFERPIRVGDTVTVGDVTGRVCRIQMRATHILDWDGKELLVPNKNIITGQLVNWTLTDTVTRVVLMVGVAYGSDVELVERVLKEVVASVDAVLAEPEPMISFLNFGESSLNFRVCVYVRELGDRMSVTHELHKKFYLALQAHHIEIPFPQRDIHVRSVAPGILQAWG